MAGSVEATVSGQEVFIDFIDEKIVLKLANFRSARRLNGTRLPAPAVIARFLRFSDKSLHAQIGAGRQLELFPNPGWLVRLLSPQLRKLART